MRQDSAYSAVGFKSNPYVPARLFDKSLIILAVIALTALSQLNIYLAVLVLHMRIWPNTVVKS